MTPRAIALVKVGGSIATIDRPPAFVNRELLARLGAELCEAAMPLVIVHGTGHVGKPWAHKGGFATSGYLPPEARDVALAIKNDLRGLDQRVVSALLDVGVEALGCDFETFAALESGAAKDYLETRLAEGTIPVFYGDMLREADGGYRVVSSDRMLLRIATLLPVKTALFLTDVDGVLGGDPEAVLPEISPATADRAARRASDDADVSSGMRGKLANAFELARLVDRCYIASGVVPGIVTALLRDLPAVATRVLPSP